MAKIFLSFLGNTNYGKCSYHDNNGESVEDVRFVQEATIQLFCPDCDRYIFFLTEDAERKNWQDDGHRTYDGDIIRQEGIRTRFEKLGLKDKLIPITNLPTGTTEDEIWQIFQTVYDQIEPNDQIVFDITHALRSIPMLVLSLIHYAKFLKNIQVNGIYYGVYEPQTKPAVFPILKLTTFATLQDWTSGADAFINFGSSKKISSLLVEEARFIQFNTFLSNVTNNFSTSRGGKIVSGKDFNQIQTQIQKIQNSDLLNPFRILLEKVKQKIAVFQSPKKADESSIINNLFNAVQWCIDHNLTQQGFTLLQEGIFTITLVKLGLDHSNKTNRMVVSSCFKAYKLPQEEWKDAAANYPELANNMINGTDLFTKLDVSNIMITLTNLRNDLNHGGFGTNSSDSKVFATQLKDIFELVKKTIQE